MAEIEKFTQNTMLPRDGRINYSRDACDGKMTYARREGETTVFRIKLNDEPRLIIYMHRIMNSVISFLAERTVLFSLSLSLLPVGSVKSRSRLYIHTCWTSTWIFKSRNSTRVKRKKTARRCPELHNNDTRFVYTRAFLQEWLWDMSKLILPRGGRRLNGQITTRTRRGCAACEVPRNLSSLGPRTDRTFSGIRYI